MAKQTKNSATSNAERFKRLADYMQQSRRNSRLSVRKASQMSNLPESTIRALENPTRSDLPKSNVIGLYEVYASTLGIPRSRVTRMAGEDPETKPAFTLKRLPKLKSLVVVSSVGATIAVVAVFLVVLAYAGWQGFGLISEPGLSVNSPAESFMVVDESSIEVSGEADRESTVLVNGQPTTINSETGAFSQVVFLQQGYNYITVEVVNSFSTTKTESFVVIYQPATAPA